MRSGSLWLGRSEKNAHDRRLRNEPRLYLWYILSGLPGSHYDQQAYKKNNLQSDKMEGLSSCYVEPRSSAHNRPLCKFVSVALLRLNSRGSDSFKVIPLKMMYYTDFFQIWHKCQPYIGYSITAIKRWGPRACFFARACFRL